MFQNKRAAVDLVFTWVEIVSFILLIIGFIIAFSAQSAVITYVVSFLSGTFFGKIWYGLKKKEKFAYFLMILFFLIGFILGSFYGDKKVTILVFILGASIGYYLFHRQLLK